MSDSEISLFAFLDFLKKLHFEILRFLTKPQYDNVIFTYGLPRGFCKSARNDENFVILSVSEIISFLFVFEILRSLRSLSMTNKKTNYDKIIDCHADFVKSARNDDTHPLTPFAMMGGKVLLAMTKGVRITQASHLTKTCI
ncbi:hypothetical protein [Helicobacter sp. T3_23-1059]